MDGREPIILTAEGRSCRLEIYSGALAVEVKNLVAPGRGLILMDRAFKDEAPAWRRDFSDFTVVLPEAAGEAVKSLDQARDILETMVKAALDRDDWLIVRGGGSLTDLGGFCAGLYRRGLRLMLIPTTLLGAVDAAVGGKTAVNLGGAKNQVGHFYLPEYVLADLAAIRALPEERLAEGLVEAYKTGLLLDRRLTALVEERTDELLAGDERLLAEVIRRSVRAKAAAVERDFREEKNLREFLNLGHTYGHAAEALIPGLSHGRAVALGLAVMAEMSRAHGLSEAEVFRITAAVRRLGGPWPDLPPEAEILRLLRADKKNRGGRLRFVVLKALRQPAIIYATPEEILRAAQTALSNQP